MLSVGERKERFLILTMYPSLNHNHQGKLLLLILHAFLKQVRRTMRAYKDNLVIILLGRMNILGWNMINPLLVWCAPFAKYMVNHQCKREAHG